MEEKELKTSLKTRIFIAVIAVIMVGSIIASYIAIVLSGNQGTDIDQAKLAEYQEQYTQAQEAFESGTKGDFDKFVPYRSEIVAYDEAAANADGLQKRDLVEGTGTELTESDTNYLAFYAGWCADGSIFDSTFNSKTDPTAFINVLNVPMYGTGLIEGWKAGVVGMKLGGIREITVPGEQAYPEQEVCGGKAKPLKFLIMAVANEEPLSGLTKTLETASMNMQYYAMYGVSYDEMMSGASENAANESGDAGETTEVVETTGTAEGGQN